MTAEGRKEKRREETGRPNSRPDPAGRAPRAKRRRCFETTGDNHLPLLLDGRVFYYFASLARMSKTKTNTSKLLHMVGGPHIPPTKHQTNHIKPLTR